MRIRWRGVVRVAAIVFVGLLAARLLPGFLRSPEPPPLAADVGLPKAAPVRDVPRPAGAVTDVPHPHPGRHRRPHRPRSRPHPVPDTPASRAVIGSKHRHRVAAKPPPPAPESAPTVLPEAVPEPPPEPPPAPPSTPGDGSQEFAPH